MNKQDTITALLQYDIPESHYLLGILYSTGTECVDFGACLKHLHAAAEAGLPDAWFELGMLYHPFGRMNWDFNESKRHLEHAVSLGHVKACMFLDALYCKFESKSSGRKMRKTQFQEAKAIMEEQAQMQNIFAMHALGSWYFAQCTKEDFKKAFSYFEAASALGHIDSTWYVAKMYHEGLGVKRSYPTAKVHYAVAEKLVKQQNADVSLKQYEIEGKSWDILLPILTAN